MIDCIYSCWFCIGDVWLRVHGCVLPFNPEHSPIERQTVLAKQEPSMIARNVKTQLTELTLNLAIKHLTHFFNLCLPPAPSPVTVIKKEKTSRNSVSLSWQQPERPNGIILDYEIKYYEKVGAGLITDDELHNSSLFPSLFVWSLQDAAAKKKPKQKQQLDLGQACK